MKFAATASAASFLALATFGHAAISVAGNNLGASGLILADAAGTPLPVGSLVRVGFFNDPVADITVISGIDFSAIDSIFHPLGEGAANAGTVSSGSLTISGVPEPGKFSFNIQNIQQSYLPQDKLMFYWVFNAPSAPSATQWAIFTNDDENDGNIAWLSKLEDTDVPGSGDLSLAVQRLRVDEADISDVITGSLSDDQLRLQIIPEPGLGALCLSAAATLLFRRRCSC